jgi:hypothetical protein
LTNADASTNTAPAETAPRALPVDPSLLAAVTTNAAPPDAPAPTVAPRALPVDPAALANPPPAAAPVDAENTNVAPRALPVDPSELTNAAPAAATLVAVNTPPPAAPETATNAGPVEPPAATPTTATSAKRLVLTASQDSFVRVTDLDAPDADKPLYAAVLHSGQSVGFDGHKFSINVGIPSAVDIQLDGVNYGPHSDQQAPETFIVQSHLP